MNYFFDYFDTIAHRKCYPEATKKIWAFHLVDVLDLSDVTGLDIYKKRGEIEAELCKRNELLVGDLEFKVENCYRELYRCLNIKNFSEDSFIEMCLKLEVDVECSVQVIDKDVATQLKRNKKQGKKNYIVSDFYLPKSAFIEMLRFHGLENLVDDIFVSSEYCVTKRSGRLYEKVLSKLNLCPDNCYMFGDNIHSDKIMAEKVGITSTVKDNEFYAEKYKEWKREEGRVSFEDKLKRIFQNNLEEAVFPEFIYEIFCFCKCIADYIVKNEISNVWFLAREGQFLKKCFEIYCSELMPSRRYNLHYVYTSRRATFLPSLKRLDSENFETLFRQYVKISPIEFFKSLGMQSHISFFRLRYPDISFDCAISDFPNSKFFQTLRKDDQFKYRYEKERGDALENAYTYFSQFINVSGEKIAIVDVGWKGTIQDNIEGFFKNLSEDKKEFCRPELHGIYLGLVNGGCKLTKTGMLFDARNGKESVFGENKSLFETILAADHGSTVCYDKTVDGKTVARLDELKEKDIYFDQIAPLLASYLTPFELIVELYATELISRERLLKEAKVLYRRIALYPTEKEVSWFQSMFHEENFGVYQNSLYSIGKEKSVVKRILNGVKLIWTRKLPCSENWPFLYVRNYCGEPFVSCYRLFKY